MQSWAIHLTAQVLYFLIRVTGKKIVLAYIFVVRVKGDNELEMISRGFSTPDKELTLSEAFSLLLLSFLVAVVIVVGVETK